MGATLLSATLLPIGDFMDANERGIRAPVSGPALRSVLIVIWCSFGFWFSLTGIAIGWRSINPHVAA